MTDDPFMLPVPVEEKHKNNIWEYLLLMMPVLISIFMAVDGTSA
jgi:hypothetical protein